MAVDYSWIMESGREAVDEWGIPLETVTAEEQAEIERDQRVRREIANAVSTYEFLKSSGDTVHLTEYFDQNRELLEGQGIVHYPPLSTDEQQVIAKWQEFDKYPGKSGKQEFWNQHRDTIIRRWRYENPSYQPKG